MDVKRLMLVALVAGLPMFSPPVIAHHGSAAYDLSKVTTMKGTVTDFQFINPHVEIYFDVTSPAGDVQKWVAEGVSVGSMARGGWTRNTLKVGDQITIEGHSARNGSRAMILNKIVLSDGRTLTTERADDYAN